MGGNQWPCKRQPVFDMLFKGTEKGPFINSVTRDEAFFRLLFTPPSSSRSLFLEFRRITLFFTAAYLFSVYFGPASRTIFGVRDCIALESFLRFTPIPPSHAWHNLWTAPKVQEKWKSDVPKFWPSRLFSGPITIMIIVSVYFFAKYTRSSNLAFLVINSFRYAIKA